MQVIHMIVEIWFWWWNCSGNILLVGILSNVINLLTVHIELRQYGLHIEGYLPTLHVGSIMVPVESLSHLNLVIDLLLLRGLII